MIPLDTIECADALDYLRRLPDQCVDAVITDPPYGVGTQVSAWRSPELRFPEIIGADVVLADWIAEAYRVVKPAGAIYVFAKWTNFGEWQAHISKAGFQVRNCIVWDKVIHGTGDLYGRYAPRHEFILFAAKHGHLLRGARPMDIITHRKVMPNKLSHPYEKPVGLLQKLITSSSDIDSVILDPFAGSGATLLAARTTNRHYLGSDIDAGYVAKVRAKLAMPYQLDMFYHAVTA